MTINEWLGFNAARCAGSARRKKIMSLRRSEGTAKSRHVVKSSSYRSQGEDGDHGDDDEAWELRERSVRRWRGRLLVLRRRKKRAGPRPAQLAAAGDAAAASGQGATPSQIRVGRLGACGLRVVRFFGH